MRQIKRAAQKGFTLIELMIVVAIIGILAAVAIPMFMDSMKKAKKSEAMIQLKKLAGAAKESFSTTAAFPADAALTPGTACCTQNFQGKKKCDVVAGDWSVAAWQALDFQMDEPFFFRYAYDEGTPAGGFTASAVGDLDCDTTVITYTAVGTTAGGNLKIVYTEPPPNTD